MVNCIVLSLDNLSFLGHFGPNLIHIHRTQEADMVPEAKADKPLRRLPASVLASVYMSLGPCRAALSESTSLPRT